MAVRVECGKTAVVLIANLVGAPYARRQMDHGVALRASDAVRFETLISLQTENAYISTSTASARLLSLNAQHNFRISLPVPYS
jgi:hypothetical protein